LVLFVPTYILMKKNKFLKTFFIGALVCVMASGLPSLIALAALDWVERQPAGDVDGNWRIVASDADGSNIIIGQSGRLYTSSDSGANWTERQPAGDVDGVWTSVASDADGSNLIAGNQGGRLYTSSDSGANWTERQPAGDVNASWRIVASDADGSHLVAAVLNGRLYTSSDSGANWTERQPAGASNRAWLSASSDSDGSNLIVGYNGGRLYTSSDSGANWTERQPVGNINRDWQTASSDADGSHLVAAGSNRLYTSSDSGANWTERQPAGNVNRAWQAVGSDDDGSHIVAAVVSTSNGGRVYVSSDGGVSWNEERPAGDVNLNWWGADTNSDGSRYVVAASGGRLYTSVPDETAPTISTLSPEDNAVDVAIDTTLVLTFDETVAASSTGDIVLYSSDDEIVETIPANDGQVSVSDDEVTITLSADLDYNASYYVLVDEGAFEDESGNPFAGITTDTTWNFDAVVDVTAPTISTFSPEDDATDVAIDTTLVLTFDETMVASSTGDIVLYSSDDEIVETIPANDGQVSVNNDEVTITLSSNLTPGEGYYILVDEGAFEDGAGNAFAGIADATTWNFTTFIDEDAPTVSETYPEDNATGVPLDILSSEDMYVAFDENIVAATGNITVYDASDDSVVVVFDITSEDYIEISGSEVYLYFEEMLDYETDYYILIDEAALEDESGNPFAGITDATTWNFTTVPPLALEFERVSVNDEGEEADASSAGEGAPTVSLDGRYVAFHSDATNLIADDANDSSDVFIYDRETDTIEAVSRNDEGDLGDSGSYAPSISEDNRYIAFQSSAANLVVDDTNDSNDVFVYDRTLDTIERVSVNDEGEEGDDYAQSPIISANGRYVAFESDATNLVADDTNDSNDVFVYDRDTDTIERISINDEGAEGDSSSSAPAISSDGRYVAFQSSATNLVADDTNGSNDVFVYDRTLDTIERVSVDDEGTEGDDGSYSSTLSADGRYVAFESDATNLFVDDENGGLDSFVYDRDTDSIERIGVDGDGTGNPYISADGRYVLFQYYVDDDSGERTDIYRYDREEDELLFVTEGALEGGEVNYSTTAGALSEDGLVLTFSSSADNLVSGDTNESIDIFVYEEVVDEEEEEPEEEEEEESSGGGGSSSSHRRSSSNSSSSDSDSSSIESLIKRVNELKTILAALIGGTPSTGGSGNPACTFTRDLTINSLGEDVRCLQEFLIAQNKGPAAQALGANGSTAFFGALTQAALAEYQAVVGIVPPAGYFGPVTRAYIEGVM
jgi:photosystem II stability/assembly factor-like uncharacterized protein/6-phosphogluconolactonase (cycloisomerase 2 family)